MSSSLKTNTQQTSTTSLRTSVLLSSPPSTTITSPFTVGTNEKATNLAFCGGHCKCGACIIRLPKELDSKQPRSDDEVERLKAVHADEPW